jgi:hypothetical protein
MFRRDILRISLGGVNAVRTGKTQLQNQTSITLKTSGGKNIAA